MRSLCRVHRDDGGRVHREARLTDAVPAMDRPIRIDGAAEIQPDDILVGPGAAERDRAAGTEPPTRLRLFHQKTPM